MRNRSDIVRGVLASLLGVSSFFIAGSARATVCAPGEYLIAGAVLCQDYTECRWEERPSPRLPDVCTCTERKEQLFACATPPPNSQVTTQGTMYPIAYGVWVDDEHCAGLPHAY